MKLLVVGGSGVLSTAVVAEALGEGLDVTVINRGRRKSRIPKGAHAIVADKDDHATIGHAIEAQTFDAVIDFLCFTPSEVERSFNFYKAFARQYIFISSSAVYDTRHSGAMDEDAPKVNPDWTYSVDKYAGEERLVQLASGTGVRHTIVRPCITYDDTRIPYGIMPDYGYHATLVERIKHGKPVLTWNGGANRWNMMRVEDFAVGVVGLIGNPKAYDCAFNVCGDECPSFSDVLNVVARWVGKEVVRFDVPARFYAQEAPNFSGEILGGRSLDSVNSNLRLRQAVPRFRQTISLDDGVKRTLEAYRDRHGQKGIAWAYDAQCDRIIRKWCRLQHLDTATYRLGFTDYLHTATRRDRLTYWLEYHRDNPLVRLLAAAWGRLRKIF